MRKRRLDHCPVTGFKSRLRIRDAASLLFVEKIESHDVESTRRQTCSGHAHETAQLVRTSTVTQHHSHTRPFLLRGRIKQRRDAAEIVYRNLYFLSFHHHSTHLPKINRNTFAVHAR